MTIRKLEQIRVYGYRKNNAFKIWFDIEFESVIFKKANNKGKEKEKNLSIAIRVARKEAKKLNKRYGYPGSEKMVKLKVNGIIVDMGKE